MIKMKNILLGKDQCLFTFVYIFTLSIAFHSFPIFFQSNFNNFSSPELSLMFPLAQVFINSSLGFCLIRHLIFLLSLLEYIYIWFRILCWQMFSFGISRIGYLVSISSDEKSVFTHCFSFAGNAFFFLVAIQVLFFIFLVFRGFAMTFIGVFSL